MHPDKAEALGKIAEVSRELDTEIAQLKEAARHPRRGGWDNSLRAVGTLLVLNAGAVAVDAVEVVLRRTNDRLWEDPPDDGAAAPPAE